MFAWVVIAPPSARGILIRTYNIAKHGVTEFLRVFEDVGATFFDIEADLLLVLDDSGNISRVNPAFERATGYAESDIIGREIIRFVVMDDWAIFLRSFTAVNPDPFRLMHRESGTVKVRLIAVRFKQQRGFIVLRRTA